MTFSKSQYQIQKKEKQNPKGFWKMSKKDRKAIRKANKKYAKRKKK